MFNKSIVQLINEEYSKSKSKKVFLGGTANNSTWRKELIPMLEIDYFDPVVSDWNSEAQKREKKERETCSFCLYVITPEMEGCYSIAEVADDSNKRPEKTIFCYINPDNKFTKHQVESLDQVGEMVKENGGTWLKSLKEVATFLNKNRD